MRNTVYSKLWIENVRSCATSYSWFPIQRPINTYLVLDYRLFEMTIYLTNNVPLWLGPVASRANRRSVSLALVGDRKSKMYMRKSRLGDFESTMTLSEKRSAKALGNSWSNDICSDVSMLAASSYWQWLARRFRTIWSICCKCERISTQVYR